MPPPKVNLFGTFLKIESKIRKTIKFQNNTKLALVNEFLRNLRQMKDPGLIFQEKLKKLIFDHFCAFYSILNIRHIRIFGKVGKSQICYDFKSLRLLQKSIFFDFLFSNLQFRPIQTILCREFVIYALDLEIHIFENFRFSKIRILGQNPIYLSMKIIGRS